MEYRKVSLFKHDITPKFMKMACSIKSISWDIETTGLDWRKDKIATCQLFMPTGHIAVIIIDNNLPINLRTLLSDNTIKKIFHHALFDLRFMSYKWNVIPQNVACTKIAAKLLDVGNTESNSLQSLLSSYLNIALDKSERLSNWLSPELTDSQIEYATNDVIHLPKLLDLLEKRLYSEGLLDLAHSCFSHIPTRVQLDIMGYTDVYSY